ncbi:acyl-CoA dehydrogenase family protein [Alicyclobacillus tolerans]|uniref:acyl-CoA dehydrogenase family protein n=1 Tax=Alicyclobacillus tolerans TaxID=90970 RepID=UPI001F1A1326|nr:acyl-CoA dehydrogenase family protein [Alicyclobacillus tolerans]MCF8565240.1 acyl-CoA dehydrogenase family protein [Alicyclobacillus tolerans]
MHAYLTEEHEIFRRALRRFLENEAAPRFEQWEREKLIPREFWLKMGSQGYLCPSVPEQYGGAGVDFSYSAVINEELERIGSGMTGIGLHSDIVIPYLLSYGSQEQKQKWLPRCVTGEVITAIAMTEPGAGSDLAGIRTTAVRDGDSYIINGQKTFITNGYQADLILVVCKTDPNANPPHQGMSLVFVEADSLGFSRGRKLEKVGQHSSDTAELFFDNCRVDASNLLGEQGAGFRYLTEKLQQERLMVAISAQVTAERSLELTKEYVKTRKAFGQPISRFQNTRFKIAELATMAEIGRTFLDQLIARHIAGEDIVTQVSMAKWWSTDMAKTVIGECLQLHGGYGYMEEYEIARRYRDVAVMSIYAGTNEIMKTIIAKSVL